MSPIQSCPCCGKKTRIRHVRFSGPEVCVTAVESDHAWSRLEIPTNHVSLYTTGFYTPMPIHADDMEEVRAIVKRRSMAEAERTSAWKREQRARIEAESEAMVANNMDVVKGRDKK